MGSSLFIPDIIMILYESIIVIGLLIFIFIMKKRKKENLINKREKKEKYRQETLDKQLKNDKRR